MFGLDVGRAGRDPHIPLCHSSYTRDEEGIFVLSESHVEMLE